MIRTKFNINLQIDSENFELSFKNPSFKKLQEFKKDTLKLTQTINKLQELDMQIAFLERQLTLHEKTCNDKEALQELKELETLTKQRQVLQNEEIDINDLAKKRWAMCIYGDKKQEVEEFCESNGINFATLMEEIDTLVAEAKEKK